MRRTEHSRHSARDLPSPAVPHGQWPSVAEVPKLPPDVAIGSGQALPKITIVTPSYNQVEFIEDTIRSVLLQGYPNLEYMIMDGGSTDGTVDIIKKYEPWISHWESTPDHGQAHAINKGLDRATGDVCTYINSDDYYLPNAFMYVASTFDRLGWDLCCGNRLASPLSARMILKRSEWKSRLRPLGPPFLVEATDYRMSQESTFWSARCARGHRFDESLHYMLDVDWFCRIASQARILLTSQRLGVFREHPLSKTAQLGNRRPPVEFDKVTERWHLDPNAREQASDIISTFRRAAPLHTLKHYFVGRAEFIYTHPACEERPLGSSV